MPFDPKDPTIPYIWVQILNPQYLMFLNGGSSLVRIPHFLWR